MAVTVDLNALLRIIGAKEVELDQLRVENRQLREALEKSLEAPKKGKTS